VSPTMLGPGGTRMRGMVPALMGVAHPCGAASMMMGLTNHMMRLRSVRLLQRFTKVVVPETLSSATVADNFEADMSKPISHAKRVLGARGQIDDPARNEGAPVVNAHRNAVACPLIANHDACSERQALVRC
jgi:hypothetical protein